MSLTATPSIFEVHPDCEDSAPVWLAEARNEAWERFTSLPMPGPKDEPWRFAGIRKMALEGFGAAQAVEGSVGGDENAFVFVNNRLTQRPKPSQNGVIVCTISEAAEQHGELFRRFFHAQGAPLGSEKFQQLHLASKQSGVFVFVPRGTVVEAPIVVEHWVGEGAVFPYTLVVAEENSEVTVIDRMRSLDDTGAGFALGLFDLYAAEGAHVHYLRSQNLNLASRSLAVGSSVVGRGADVKSLLLNLGCGWSRNEHVSYLNGEAANSDMLAVSIPTGEQECDQRTFQHHRAEHTTSDLLFKNVLYDKSKSVFGGLILVDEGALHTDAYQTCRNLILSDTAEAHSMPGLEINADQVRCSHGATTGQIGEEEVFYLMARGIPGPDARRLIALGFALDVLEKISDQRIQSEAATALEAKFADLF